MQDLELQDIYIYPIKSLGGISALEAEVQPTGLEHDRRWMLTDKSGKFLTQRNNFQMALLQVSFAPGGLMITHKEGKISPLTVPFGQHTGKKITVSIWDDVCPALEVSALANEWFSDALSMDVQLVYMPATTKRLVETNYASNKEIVSFADAYPFMIIGQSSLDDLNCRLDQPLPMNRFRPNLVFKGGDPYVEDTFQTLSIGSVKFIAAKSCARCVLITIDQENGMRGKEPLKTLAGYRSYKNKVMFGQNLLTTGFGKVKVGDKVTVRKWKENVFASTPRPKTGNDNLLAG